MAVNPLCSYLDKKEDSSVNCVSLSTDLCTTDILNRPKKSLRYWLKNPESNLYFCFNTEIGLHLKYWIKRK